jgi:hypothetical protein
MSRLTPVLAEIINETFPYVDMVGVYDQLFNQVFRRARILKATVREEARVMEHPLETGATVTDHRVILPIEIELSMIVQAERYWEVYNEIKQSYLSSTLFIVQTKASVYINQLISSMPHEENPDQFDTISIALNFKEVLFFTTTSKIVPRETTNSPTIQRGQQQVSVPPPAFSSVLDGWIFKGGTP